MRVAEQIGCDFQDQEPLDYWRQTGAEIDDERVRIGRDELLEMDYTVEDRKDGRGRGVYAERPFAGGELVAVVSGEIVGEHRLHTLQLDAHTHLYDPSFTGCLLHACDPNAIINPSKREVRALRNIGIGEAITVDYAHTEDRLVRQFACRCGSPTCRHWIKGRREEINREGLRYLEAFTFH